MQTKMTLAHTLLEKREKVEKCMNLNNQINSVLPLYKGFFLCVSIQLSCYNIYIQN